jgi:hypothetical protein
MDAQKMRNSVYGLAGGGMEPNGAFVVQKVKEHIRQQRSVTNGGDPSRMEKTPE